MSDTHHELQSGAIIEVSHGAESLTITVRSGDHASPSRPRVSVALLTPGEAMTVGSVLWGRGLGIVLNAFARALTPAETADEEP